MTVFAISESATGEILDNVELTARGKVRGGLAGGAEIVSALLETVGLEETRKAMEDWSNGYVSSRLAT